MAILLMMLHGTSVFRDTRFMRHIVHIREKIPAPKILGELWALKVILRQCQVAQKQKPCSAAAKKIKLLLRRHLDTAVVIMKSS